ncbi:conserved hypothetical protein [Pediculus humanus corporis]|uniref:Uncharacterized protein n=1 Tax=Pediculus humanus subsp. corporis TaxID=121224 RepID=E0VXA5_PEDHC|nr:uncharacterized protein Phum_PHUM497880 [Pediculus humanus corporis]EEB18011.1 conserved hypothetical protein [Pediculus humanus corporis]
MSKFYLYYSLICTISFTCAIFIFTFKYNRTDGGLWAAFASVNSGICFYLYNIYIGNKLQNHFSLKYLNYLSVISFISCLVCIAFGIWYTFAIIYWKIPLSEYDRSLIFPCVFSFLSGKWGFHLHTATKKFMKEYTSFNYTPIIQNI